jgi:hypothetical protein
VLGRELQGDGATEGVPRHVGAIHSDVVGEPDGVLGLHGDAGRPPLDRAGAPAETTPVVADAPEALQRRFRHERLQRVGDVGAMDEQHGLARPHDLVLQLAPLILACSMTAPPSRLAPGGPVGKGGATCAVATRHAV